MKKITIIIPCYNEELTVAKVVEDFRRELPQSSIVVIDNNSSDRTSEVASQCGARVIFESRRGKGFAVERMFRVIDSDVYVMVDGDDTYFAKDVHKLLKPVMDESYDMVIGARSKNNDDGSYRKFHVLGNNMVNNLISTIFKTKIKDAMSGYRVFSRSLVGSLPIVSSGFEIETEITIQSLYHNLSIKEVDIDYKNRPQGSVSKLNTYRDGFKVVMKIFMLFKDLKPLTFFGAIGLFLMLTSLLAGYLPVFEYFSKDDHVITHVPLALLASSIMMIAFLNFFLGIILHSINWRLRDLHSILIRNNKGESDD